MYSFEQILEAKSHKTAAVQPLNFHLTNHPSKKKDKLINHIPLWPLTHGCTKADQRTRTYITSALCGHWMQSRRPVRSDG